MRWLFLGGLIIVMFYHSNLGWIVTVVVGLAGMLNLTAQRYYAGRYAAVVTVSTNIIYALMVAWLLAVVWMPWRKQKQPD